MSNESATVNESIAIVHPQPGPETPRTVATFLADDEYPVVCSFDLKTQQGRALLQRCEIDETTKLADRIGKPFQLEHVYATHVDKQGPTEGESVTLRKICLVATDGEVLHCFSAGVAQSIMRLIAGHGLPPWKGGVACEIRMRTFPGPKIKYYLAEVFPAVEAKRK